MIILDYQDRRPIYEQITERFRTLIYQGALPAGSETSFCASACDGTVYQSQYNPESIYDTGAGGADLSSQGKRQFCCGDHTDTGKEQGRFSKGISGTGKKRTTDGSYGRRDAFAGAKEL